MGREAEIIGVRRRLAPKSNVENFNLKMENDKRPTFGIEKCVGDRPSSCIRLAVSIASKWQDLKVIDAVPLRMSRTYCNFAAYFY